MKIPYNQKRHKKNTAEREHRLCHEKRTPERIGDAIGGAAQYLVTVTSNVTSGLYKGLESAWNADTRSDIEKQKSITMLSQFQRAMPPSISQIITNGLETEKLSLIEIDNLVQYEKWITAFETPDLFDEGKNPIQPLALKNGPMGVILSKNGEERKILFFDFGGQFIPQEVRAELAAAYDSILSGPDAISGATGKPTAIKTLKAMFDIEVPAAGSDEYKLAEASLRHRYWKDGNAVNPTNNSERYTVSDPNADKNPSGALAVNGTTETLFEEAQQSMKFAPKLASTAELGSVLPPSLLRGAIGMGVVGNQEFSQLDTFIDERSKETLQLQLGSSRDLKELTGVVDANLQREMTGFTDIFDSMGGIEKIALIVFAAFLVKQTPEKKPKLPMALGGLYFAQKFFLKMDNPIDDAWSPVISGMTQKFTGLTKPWMKAVGINLPDDPASVVDIDRLSNHMHKYVTEVAKSRASSAINGFAILADMPLDQLKQYLTIGESGRMVLDGSNKDLRAIVGQQLRRKGLDAYKTRAFFKKMSDDPSQNIDIQSDAVLFQKFGPAINKNLADAGDVLGFVYYSIGAKQDGSSSERVRIVEYAQKNAPGGRLANLATAMPFEGKTVNPRREYQYLVRLGMFNSGSETLGTFVQGAIGAVDKTPEEIATEKARKFEGNKGALLDYEHRGVKYGLEAKQDGTSVKIGIPDNRDYDMTITFNTFIGNTFDPKDLTNQWIAKTEKILEIKGGAPSGTPIGSLTVTFEGEVVKFTLNTIHTHKTTLELFRKHPKAEFWKKLDKWNSDGADVSIDPLE